MTEFGNKVGQEAQNGAENAPENLCLRYVANAFKRALGKPQGVAGVEHAKDSASLFTKDGYYY